MARKIHFLSGLGNAAINAADSWWEKEKAKSTKHGVSKREAIDDAIDDNNIIEASMESDMGY
jgi:hypothetical protein